MFVVCLVLSVDFFKCVVEEEVDEEYGDTSSRKQDIDRQIIRFCIEDEFNEWSNDGDFHQEF